MPASYTSHSGTRPLSWRRPAILTTSVRAFTNTASPKFMVPRLSVPISAPSTSDPRRSSTLIPTAPPVEHWTTTSQPAPRMRSTISWKCASSWEGRPSGQRACRCTTAAPARQASTAACAISAGVYGTCGLCARVTSAPTTAAVMMTSSIARSPPLLLLRHDAGAGGAADHHRVLEHVGRAVGQVGARRDHLARLEAHGAGGGPHPRDLPCHLDVVAGVH